MQCNRIRIVIRWIVGSLPRPDSAPIVSFSQGHNVWCQELPRCASSAPPEAWYVESRHSYRDFPLPFWFQSWLFPCTERAYIASINNETIGNVWRNCNVCVTLQLRFPAYCKLRWCYWRRFSWRRRHRSPLLHVSCRLRRTSCTLSFHLFLF